MMAPIAGVPEGRGWASSCWSASLCTHSLHNREQATCGSTHTHAYTRAHMVIRNVRQHIRARTHGDRCAHGTRVHNLQGSSAKARTTRHHT